jgi:DnaJ-class molecular chaperone
MCHGAGYRKDMVTYDKYTGNTGGPAKCGHCGGTGQYTVMGCSKCDGKGFVRK